MNALSIKMQALGIPISMLGPIIAQAEQEYPHECCGMIFGARAKGALTRVRPCANVQDKYHALDPKNFPRTATAAYFIDPKELLAIQKEMRENGEEMRVIYHSHINAGAYFSEEDKRVALCEGEPAYPGVAYLVLSVLQGKVQDGNLYDWNPAKKDFLTRTPVST